MTKDISSSMYKFTHNNLQLKDYLGVESWRLVGSEHVTKLVHSWIIRRKPLTTDHIMYNSHKK